MNKKYKLHVYVYKYFIPILYCSENLTVMYFKDKF